MVSIKRGWLAAKLAYFLMCVASVPLHIGIKTAFMADLSLAIKISNAKFEAEKFNDQNNFDLWQIKVWCSKIYTKRY